MILEKLYFFSDKISNLPKCWDDMQAFANFEFSKCYFEGKLMANLHSRCAGGSMDST